MRKRIMYRRVFIGKAKKRRTVLIAGIVLLTCFSLFFLAGCSRRMKSDGDFIRKARQIMPIPACRKDRNAVRRIRVRLLRQPDHPALGRVRGGRGGPCLPSDGMRTYPPGVGIRIYPEPGGERMHGGRRRAPVGRADSVLYRQYRCAGHALDGCGRDGTQNFFRTDPVQHLSLSPTL